MRYFAPKGKKGKGWLVVVKWYEEAFLLPHLFSVFPFTKTGGILQHETPPDPTSNRKQSNPYLLSIRHVVRSPLLPPFCISQECFLCDQGSKQASKHPSLVAEEGHYGSLLLFRMMGGGSLCTLYADSCCPECMMSV